jgi:hypothetical protein
VEDPGIDQLVDGATGLEARVEGQPWVRPSQATRELLVDVGTDALVADLQRPSGERLIVADEAVTNLEDVQRAPLLVDGKPKGELNLSPQSLARRGG